MKPVIPRYNPETEWLYAPDVPYAQRGEKQLCMQLIFPYRRDLPKDERYPAVLFIPGAAWYRQEMYNSVPQWAKLAEQGMVFAAVQVRSSREAHFPAQTVDVLDALRLLIRDAARWHIDPNRIFLAGQSSGGHIALLTLLMHQQMLPDICPLQGVIACSAPTDMRLCGGQPSLDLLGVGSLADAPEKVAAASCGTYIPTDSVLPPILLLHGEQDGVVPIAHSEGLMQLLRKAGQPTEMLRLPGVGHGGAAFWRGDALAQMAAFVLNGGFPLRPGN